MGIIDRLYSEMRNTVDHVIREAQIAMLEAKVSVLEKTLAERDTEVIELHVKVQKLHNDLQDLRHDGQRLLEKSAALECLLEDTALQRDTLEDACVARGARIITLEDGIRDVFSIWIDQDRAYAKLSKLMKEKSDEGKKTN